jgi:sulfate transport system substrate-binding protein
MNQDQAPPRLAASGLAPPQQTLLNVSYDVAREFYKDINAAFVPWYKKTTGKDVKIEQSHGGSSAQARAVADGLDADVVTMNTTTDVEFLAEKGVVAKDWAKRFPDNAAPTTSTMLFLVRNGNPKGIKDWDDLVKPGVQVVVVNPKTGGNGRYAYLAAWGYVKKKGGTDAQAADFVSKLYKNVPVLARGGRDATTAFLQRNIGDVLITFESEVESVNKEFGANKVDVVYPVDQHRGREPGGGRRAHGGQEGHGGPRQGLPELPVLGRGPGDRGEAQHPPANEAVLKKYAAPSSRSSCSRCRSCSARCRKRRRCTSTTAASSTRSTPSSKDA